MSSVALLPVAQARVGDTLQLAGRQGSGAGHPLQAPSAEGRLASSSRPLEVSMLAGVQACSAALLASCTDKRQPHGQASAPSSRQELLQQLQPLEAGQGQHVLLPSA